MHNASLEPKNISKRQKKFRDRGLKELGFNSYGEYIDSPHWKDFKERYRASRRPEPGYWEDGLPQTCIVCYSPNVDLHHKTYERLGNERLTDVVPLCRYHHDQLHAEGLDLWTGPNILRDRELERRGIKKYQRPKRVSIELLPA